MEPHATKYQNFKTFNAFKILGIQISVHVDHIKNFSCTSRVHMMKTNILQEEIGRFNFSIFCFDSWLQQCHIFSYYELTVIYPFYNFKYVSSMFKVYSKNFSSIVETFLFGSNGLNYEENALIIELTMNTLQPRKGSQLHCYESI